jgi:O-antigen ligase
MSPSRFRSLLLLLFYGTLICLPLSANWLSDRWHFGLLMPAEPLMALTVGGLILGVLFGWVAWPQTTRRLDKLIGLHFGAVFLATVFSGDPLVSAKYLVTLLLYVAFGYGVPRVLRLQRLEWFWTVGALVLGTTLLVVYVLVQQSLMGISYEISYSVAKPFLQHGHTNLTVMLEPLVLILNLVLLYHPWVQRFWTRALTTAFLTGVLMVVAFSYSRTSYVSLTAQALLLLANAGWSTGRRLLLPWSVAGLVILAAWQLVEGVHPNAAPASAPKLLHELKSVSDFSPANESNAERKSRWLYSLELFQQEPLVGIGPGTFPDRYLDFVRHAEAHPTYWTTMRRMNAHNLYVDWLVESGVLGLATGLILLGYVMWRQARWAFGWRLTPGRVGFTVYFLFFLLHSLTQDFWQEPRVVVVFWLALGLQRYCTRTAVLAPSAPVAA